MLLFLISLNQQELFGIEIEVQRFVPCTQTILKDFLLYQLLLGYLAVYQTISVVRTVVTAQLRLLPEMMACIAGIQPLDLGFLRLSLTLAMHCLLDSLVLQVTCSDSCSFSNLLLLIFFDARPQTPIVIVIKVYCLVNILVLIQYFGFVELEEEFGVSQVRLLDHRVLEVLEVVLVPFSLQLIDCLDKFQFFSGSLRVHELKNAFLHAVLDQPSSQAGVQAAMDLSRLSRYFLSMAASHEARFIVFWKRALWSLLQRRSRRMLAEWIGPQRARGFDGCEVSVQE